jgi:hypothetical protein
MSKIPQGEWNAIAARYQGGESISKIARSYSCTPPAIHYILKRIRQKPAKISGDTSSAAGPAAFSGFRAKSPERSIPTPLNVEARATGRTALPAAPGTVRDAPKTTLRNEKSCPVGAPPQLVGRAPEPSAPPRPPTAPLRPAIAEPPAAPFSEGCDAGPVAARSCATAPAVLPGLDDALHLRAEAAIALFRSSFDRALTEGSLDVRERLRQAANDLMRVAARTTIVLDRLNAASERLARTQNYPRSAHAGDDFGKLS